MTRPEAKTTGGVVRGITRGDLSSWRGIPYAAAPVGPRRFRAPGPVEPWEGVRDAAEFGAVPVQERVGEFVGAGRHTPMSEDSLTLNVVAPADPSPAPRPVMVWLYGGAFVVGASSSPTYRGYDLVRGGDVVYVSVNYRLGALGWLDFAAYSTAEHPMDSNLGLRDQIAALEWVRDNIAAFGGDPDNVTLFGESAGAISVTTLLTVPSAAGLFHRAIAESSAPGLAYARERIERAGLSDRVTLKLQDYRDEAGTYDGVASIEMFEAVGERYWPAYFETLRRCLKPGRTAALQIITVADRRWELYRSSVDFIQRYIFPGGMLPSPKALRAEVERAGLKVLGSMEFGESYSRTLRLWHEAFNERWAEVQRLGFDDRFRRMWDFYLTSCAAAFRSGACDVTQIAVTRPA